MSRWCCEKQRKDLSKFVWKGGVYCTYCDAFIKLYVDPKEKPGASGKPAPKR